MNTKISEAVAWLGTGPNGGADVVTTDKIKVREWVRLGLTIIPLMRQPAELAEQQGERERFEKWASHWRRGLDLGRANGGPILVDGEYLDGMAASMWECWQAALAATGKQQVDPTWSLHDRVEFALRDAGFDFDEASRIALQVDGKQQVGEVQGDALVDTARRNIRQFISRASFSSSVDKQAALSCVDVLEEALAARQRVVKGPIGYTRDDALETLEMYGTAMLHAISCNPREGFSFPLYAAPPAQGLDPSGGMAQEYQRWIDFYHAGEGSYDDFLSKHVLIDQRDAAPGVGYG